MNIIKLKKNTTVVPYSSPNSHSNFHSVC